MVTAVAVPKAVGQGQAYGNEPDVVPEVFSQIRESYAAGV
jgi:hypothetical protein